MALSTACCIFSSKTTAALQVLLVWKDFNFTVSLLMLSTEYIFLMNVLHLTSSYMIHESDYQKKIDECKQKTEQARSEVVADAELDLLQRELDEELEKERMLGEELR